MKMRNDSPIAGKETISFDVTAIVRAWLSKGCLNNGLRLSFDCIDNKTPLLTFYSTDCQNERQTPYLKVSYHLSSDDEEGYDYDHHGHCADHGHEVCKEKYEHKNNKCSSPGEAIGCLLESVALEEKMIAQLLKAESDKIQKVICIPGSSVEDLLDIDESVNNTLKNIFKVEALLQFKLENIANMMRHPSEQDCD